MSEELREIKWISYGNMPLVNLSRCDLIKSEGFNLVFYGKHRITWEFKTYEEINIAYDKIKNAICFNLEQL